MLWRLRLIIESFVPFRFISSVIPDTDTIAAGLVWTSLLVAIPANIFIRGLGISLAWGWFIAPVTGWREISLVEGVGISIFFSIALDGLAARTVSSDNDPSETTFGVISAVLGRMVLSPLISILFAWGWQTFFMAAPA